MNAAATAKRPTAATKDHRERVRHYSKMTVKDIFTTRMRDLELTNMDMKNALGYTMPNVIAMIRSGGMRLPVNKVIAAADKLQVDRSFLLIKLLEENDAELADAIKKASGQSLISQNELKLISFIRSHLDGFDLDLAESKEFTATVKPMLKAISKKAEAEMQAGLDAAKRDAKAA